MCENSIVLIGHITSSSVNPLLVHTCQRLGFWLSRQVRLGLTCSTEGLTRQQQGRICAAVPETPRGYVSRLRPIRNTDRPTLQLAATYWAERDRKRVVSGKSVYVSVAIVCGRIIKKKQNTKKQ